MDSRSNNKHRTDRTHRMRESHSMSKGPRVHVDPIFFQEQGKVKDRWNFG